MSILTHEKKCHCNTSMCTSTTSIYVPALHLSMLSVLTLHLSMYQHYIYPCINTTSIHAICTNATSIHVSTLHLSMYQHYIYPCINTTSIHVSTPSLVVSIFQAAIRGWLARHHYVIIHKRLCAAVVIQSAWRGFLCRRDFLTIRGAAVVIQSTWKGIITRRQ